MQHECAKRRKNRAKYHKCKYTQTSMRPSSNKRTKIHQTIIKDLDFSLSTHPNSDINNCNSNRLYMM
jgi:hypothetical protein